MNRRSRRTEIYRDCGYVIREIGGFIDILGMVLYGKKDEIFSMWVDMKSSSQHGLTRSGRDAYFDMSA